MKNKGLALTGLTILLASTLVGCSNTNSSSKKDSDKITQAWTPMQSKLLCLRCRNLLLSTLVIEVSGVNGASNPHNHCCIKFV